MRRIEVLLLKTFATETPPGSTWTIDSLTEFLDSKHGKELHLNITRRAVYCVLEKFKSKEIGLARWHGDWEIDWHKVFELSKQHMADPRNHQDWITIHRALKGKTQPADWFEHLAKELIKYSPERWEKVISNE